MELKAKLKKAIDNCNPLLPSEEREMLDSAEYKNLVKKYLLTFPISNLAFEKLVEDKNINLLKLCIKSSHLHDYEQAGFVKAGDVELFRAFVKQLTARKMTMSHLAQKALFALPAETRLEFLKIYLKSAQPGCEVEHALIETGDSDLIRYYFGWHKAPREKSVQLALFDLGDPKLIGDYLDNVDCEEFPPFEVKDALCEEAQIRLIDLKDVALLAKYLKTSSLCNNAKARLLDTKDLRFVEAYFQLL